jgi:di/tricarboxylate transporter
MVVGGAVSMEGAYRAIHWESVVLIAAILPMSTALDVSGGLDVVVGGLVGALGGAGPLLVMGALFVLTSAFSQVISNTATTVLLAPVAFQSALDLGVSPEAMLMAIAVAASTAFATPVASPVNALVLTPGRYRFGDFVKVGLPIVLLMLVATLLVVPAVFPLNP